MALTVGSLFSGIGGIDLGLERAGMVTRWFVEIDPHCRNVLARHWPGLPIYGDITTVDWSGVEPVDVLAGGFPCQPVSGAGKRAAQADPRWLWPQFDRAIRALRPRYVFVENVADLLAVNDGSAMGDVLSDLAASGYDAEWDCIPAAAVGAIHDRDRVWIVAYASGDRRTLGGARDSGRDPETPHGKRVWDESRGDSAGGIAWVGSNTDSDEHESRTSANGRAASAVVLADADGPRHPITRHSRTPGTGVPRIFAGSALDRSGWWTTEPDVGRVADGVPHRVDRLRSLGNAVVPQVVEFIGHRIVAFDEGREVRAA